MKKKEKNQKKIIQKKMKIFLHRNPTLDSFEKKFLNKKRKYDVYIFPEFRLPFNQVAYYPFKQELIEQNKSKATILFIWNCKKYAIEGSLADCPGGQSLIYCTRLAELPTRRKMFLFNIFYSSNKSIEPGTDAKIAEFREALSPRFDKKKTLRDFMEFKFHNPSYEPYFEKVKIERVSLKRRGRYFHGYDVIMPKIASLHQRLDYYYKQHLDTVQRATHLLMRQQDEIRPHNKKIDNQIKSLRNRAGREYEKVLRDINVDFIPGHQLPVDLIESTVRLRFGDDPTTLAKIDAAKEEYLAKVASIEADVQEKEKEMVTPEMYYQEYLQSLKIIFERYEDIPSILAERKQLIEEFNQSYADQCAYCRKKVLLDDEGLEIRHKPRKHKICDFVPHVHHDGREIFRKLFPV